MLVWMGENPLPVNPEFGVGGNRRLGWQRRKRTLEPRPCCRASMEWTIRHRNLKQLPTMRSGLGDWIQCPGRSTRRRETRAVRPTALPLRARPSNEGTLRLTPGCHSRTSQGNLKAHPEGADGKRPFCGCSGYLRGISGDNTPVRDRHRETGPAIRFPPCRIEERDAEVSGSCVLKAIVGPRSRDSPVAGPVRLAHLNLVILRRPTHEDAGRVLDEAAGGTPRRTATAGPFRFLRKKGSGIRGPRNAGAASSALGLFCRPPSFGGMGNESQPGRLASTIILRISPANPSRLRPWTPENRKAPNG